MNDITDLVSVIIPIYNHERYLEKCLDSIYQDSYPRIELLAIDDCSKDSSFATATEWSHKFQDRFERVNISKNDTNLGVCKTLNKLVSQCQGKFICIVASDDYLLQGGIIAKVDALKQHPDWLAVCADAHIIDENGNLIAESALVYNQIELKLLTKRQSLVKAVLTQWEAPLQIMLFKREAFLSDDRGVGLYDESSSFEDLDMAYRLVYKNAYGFINIKAYAYRIFGTTQDRCIKTPSSTILRDTAKIYNKYADIFDFPHNYFLYISAKLMSYETKNINYWMLVCVKKILSYFL
jgi:glycosyltransferase involved in cell wall biosynthesis